LHRKCEENHRLAAGFLRNLNFLAGMLGHPHASLTVLNRHVTTPALPTGRPAATRHPFRAVRLLLVAAFLGLAFPALAQEAVVPGIGLENIAVAVNAAAAEQTASTGDRALAAAAAPVAPAHAGTNRSATDRPARPSSAVQTLLKRALALLGTPYRWGGTGTNGFDCSGLVGYVFKTALGVELPRVSRDMVHAGQRVDRSALSAGDIVFFKLHGKRVDHVGIYVGNGQFLHAPRTGKDVMVSRLDQGYWSGKFMEARRVAGL
jgi:cell wall-associated NlpC family hydrolase